MRSVFGASIVCALVIWTSGASVARAATVDGPRILVTFAANATPTERAAAAASVGGVIASTISPISAARIVAAAGRDAEGAIDAVARMPGVRFADRTPPARLSFVP